MFYTYVIYSKTKDKYYIGYTHNLKLRLHRHNAGWSKSTKSGIPWEIAYYETFHKKAEAIKREKHLKRMKSKKFLEKLVKER